MSIFKQPTCHACAYLTIIFSPRGELILTDTPLFIVPDSAHTDNPEDLNRILSTEVENLNQEDREYFYSLADCKVGQLNYPSLGFEPYFGFVNKFFLHTLSQAFLGHKAYLFRQTMSKNLRLVQSGDSKTARGIYFTNCFTIGCYAGSPTAMLPRLSRINHSCRPNTEFHWEAGQGAEHLRAIRDIRSEKLQINSYNILQDIVLLLNLLLKCALNALPVKTAFVYLGLSMVYAWSWS